MTKEWKALPLPSLVFLLSHFATYNAHPRFWPKLSGKKIFHVNFSIQFLVYLYLERKPIIIFQGIILHMDIVIAF